MAEGALALARALHPAAPKADLVEIADALLSEDRTRPYARRFSDGWRVWHPGREMFVGAAVGQPFRTQGEAEARRRELAGEAVDDGPMFRGGAGGGGAAPAAKQLGLFGARENPGAVGHLEFGRNAHGSFTVGSRGVTGEVWSYVDVFDTDGRPLGGGSAITTFGPDGVGPAWVSRGEVGAGTHRGIVYPRARWADADAGVIVVERREVARRNPSHLAPLRGAPGEAVTYHRLADGMVLARVSHAGAGTSERELSPSAARTHRARLLSLGYRENPGAPDGSPNTVYALVRNIYGRRLPYTLQRPHRGSVGSVGSVANMLQNEMSDDEEASAGQTLIVATNARGEPWWVVTPNLRVYRVGSPEAAEFLGAPVAPGFARRRAKTALRRSR